MKTSDFIVDYLEQAQFRFAAGVSGGAIMHLMHSLLASTRIKTVFTHHEQAAVMAADGYSRAGRGIGNALVFATSGPGATNILTGLAGAFYDSVPLMAITGQASTFRQVGQTGVRQVGFQETPIVEMARPVTKFARKINNESNLGEILNEALEAMTSGRPGPVLIDIPDDILRSNLSEVRKYNFPPIYTQPTSDKQLSSLQDTILSSQRPVVVLGAGLNVSQSRQAVPDMISKLGIPAVATWGAADLVSPDHEMFFGLFGTHGQRLANLIVQNADLIIGFGTKLDTKSTGTPVSSFAPKAKKVLIDLDQAEMGKFSTFGLDIEQKILGDAFSALSSLASMPALRKKLVSDWIKGIRHSRVLIDSETQGPKDRATESSISPNYFFKVFSQVAGKVDDFVLDTGNTLGWFLNNFKLNQGQRIWHDYNNTAMGWSIPAAIGIGMVRNSNLITIVGDGALMMTLGDLITLRANHSKAKVILVNNGGYAMIRQTQDQWFDSNFIGSDNRHLHFPAFSEVAKGAGFNFLRISSSRGLRDVLRDFVATDEATFIELMVDPNEKLVPQVKFGSKLEDMDPPITEDLMRKVKFLLGQSD
jgi:acetolactate synthase-1/2/3 large subunit